MTLLRGHSGTLAHSAILSLGLVVGCLREAWPPKPCTRGFAFEEVTRCSAHVSGNISYSQAVVIANVSHLRPPGTVEFRPRGL